MRSVEFLFHYQCAQCGDGFGRGDRYPLDTWYCLKCNAPNQESETTLHPLMSLDERRKFADMLESWAVKLRKDVNV
jgi:ribosomal protein L37AE/L43A